MNRWVRKGKIRKLDIDEHAGHGQRAQAGLHDTLWGLANKWGVKGLLRLAPSHLFWEPKFAELGVCNCALRPPGTTQK